MKKKAMKTKSKLNASTECERVHIYGKWKCTWCVDKTEFVGKHCATVESSRYWITQCNQKNTSPINNNNKNNNNGSATSNQVVLKEKAAAAVVVDIWIDVITWPNASREDYQRKTDRPTLNHSFWYIVYTYNLTISVK